MLTNVQEVDLLLNYLVDVTALLGTVVQMRALFVKHVTNFVTAALKQMQVITQVVPVEATTLIFIVLDRTLTVCQAYQMALLMDTQPLLPVRQKFST